MAKKQRALAYASQEQRLSTRRVPPPPTESVAPPPSAQPDPRTPGSALWPRSFGDLIQRFFAIDLRALAAFRMALAVLVFCDLWVRLPDLTAQYTELGVFPLQAARIYDASDWAMLSPYMYAETAGQAGFLFALTMLGCLALLVGWRTRMANVLVWFLISGLHTRMPLNLHSGDVLERMLLFWAMFLPLGARWSLDGGAAGWKARGMVPPQRHLSWGSAALLLQVGILYLFTFILKDGPEWRVTHDAVYYALALDLYRTWFGGWLLSQHWTIVPLTWFTILLEGMAMPLAFLPVATARVRTALVAMMWCFHVIALNLAFDLGDFPYVCLVAWIPFLPTGFWNHAEALWRQLPASDLKKTLTAIVTRVIAWRNRRITKSVARHARPMPLRASRLGQVVCCLCLLYVIWFNVRGLDTPVMKKHWITVQNSEVLKGIMWVGRLDQDWRMFAPRPSSEDGWFIVAAHTVRGETFNVVRGARPLSYDKPSNIPGDFTSERWRKYLMNLWGSNNTQFRRYYLDYKEREWDEAHSRDDMIENIQMIYMLETTLPNFKTAPVRPIVLDEKKPEMDKTPFRLPASMIPE